MSNVDVCSPMSDAYCQILAVLETSAALSSHVSCLLRHRNFLLYCSDQGFDLGITSNIAYSPKTFRLVVSKGFA